MSKVTFDYSKATGFISEADIQNMKEKTLAAREMISLDGLIFLLIMTRKNLTESRLLQRKSRMIPRYSL